MGEHASSLKLHTNNIIVEKNTRDVHGPYMGDLLAGQAKAHHEDRKTFVRETETLHERVEKLKATLEEAISQVQMEHESEKKKASDARSQLNRQLIELRGQFENQCLHHAGNANRHDVAIRELSVATQEQRELQGKEKGILSASVAELKERTAESITEI